jgi:hypothetical protein
MGTLVASLLTLGLLASMCAAASYGERFPR